MSSNIGFLLDGLILVFLAVTIFYAARLSLFLKSFRDGRNGMQLLIRDLSVTIDKAEESIKGMKEDVQQTEDDLRKVVEEARFLADELRIMNESGNNLADRLEQVSSSGREAPVVNGYREREMKEEAKHKARRGKIEEPFDIEDFEIDEDDETDFWALGDGAYREEDIPKAVDTESKSKVRSFAIFDRDFMDDDAPHSDDQDNGGYEGTSFSSRAEQDLYEALQRKKRVRETS